MAKYKAVRNRFFTAFSVYGFYTSAFLAIAEPAQTKTTAYITDISRQISMLVVLTLMFASVVKQEVVQKPEILISSVLSSMSVICKMRFITAGMIIAIAIDKPERLNNVLSMNMKAAFASAAIYCIPISAATLPMSVSSPPKNAKPIAKLHSIIRIYTAVAAASISASFEK